MNDLESRLAALGRELAFPPTPALALPAESPGRERRWRPVRLAAVVLALTVAVLGAVLALSAGAQSAFREVFHLGGVEVIRLGDPPAAAGRLVPFGSRTTFEDAQRAVPFPILLPATEEGRPPSAVYLDRGAGIVSLVWCCERRIVLSELATVFPGFLEKTLGRYTRLERLALDGAEALWIEGADHVIRVVREHAPPEVRAVGVSGAVLIWERNGVTYRLEGEVSREQAVLIARSVR